MAKVDPKNRTALERLLGARLQEQKAPVQAKVQITDDGRFAFFVVGRAYTCHQLSQRGKEFLSNGSATLDAGESFLEPSETRKGLQTRELGVATVIANSRART